MKKPEKPMKYKLKPNIYNFFTLSLFGLTNSPTGVALNNPLISTCSPLESQLYKLFASKKSEKAAKALKSLPEAVKAYLGFKAYLGATAYFGYPSSPAYALTIRKAVKADKDLQSATSPGAQPLTSCSHLAEKADKDLNTTQHPVDLKKAQISLFLSLSELGEKFHVRK